MAAGGTSLEGAFDEMADKQDKANMTLSERLSLARKEFRDNLSRSKELGRDTEEGKKAFELAAKSLGEIQNAEGEARRAQIMNPIAGGAPVTSELQRIMSMGDSPEVLALEESQRNEQKKMVKATKADDKKSLEAQKDVTESGIKSAVKATTRISGFGTGGMGFGEFGGRMNRRKVGKGEGLSKIGLSPLKAGLEDFANANKDFKRIPMKLGIGEDSAIIGKLDDVKDEVTSTGVPEDVFSLMNASKEEIEAYGKAASEDLTPAQVAAKQKAQGNDAAVPPMSTRKNIGASETAAQLQDITGLSAGRQDMAAVSGARGPGLGTAESAGIRLSGEIRVTVNNEAFKAQVVNIIAESIGHATVKESLTNNGYLRGR